VAFYVDPTAGDLTTQSARQLFQKAMTDIWANQNGFIQAPMPFTYQNQDLALTFSLPAGTQQQMTWGNVYNLMSTCFSFYISYPDAPAKEVTFQMQGSDQKSWGEGKMVLAKPGKRRRRQITSN
ncbi:MAG: hypothetical protein Q9164_007728, partial [Protoblastenia rupestris]